jgi:predicted RNA-binding protein associated with RNAse of E/G family
MKRKYANRPDWKRIIEREYKQLYVEDDDFTGYISLLVLNKVKEPLFVNVPGKEDFCVADHNYKWLQYSSTRKNHSMTAMFNDKGEVIQWYFDIARKASLSSEGIPYFDDLFLDVVVLPNMEYFLLDEDELQEALEHQVIQVDEYNLAKREAEKIMESIKEGNNQLIDRSRRDMKMFEGNFEDGNNIR